MAKFSHLSFAVVYDCYHRRVGGACHLGPPISRTMESNFFASQNYHFLVVPAFLVMIGGLIIRLMAFYTAKSNFTHLIQE
jgi:hypothetical protein